MRRLSEQQQRQRLTVYLICVAAASTLFFFTAALVPGWSWFVALALFLAVMTAAITAVMAWVMIWTWKNSALEMTGHLSHRFNPASEIQVIQAEVNAWVTQNFDNSELTAVVGLVEEVGELCRAVVKMEQGIRGTREEWFQEIRKESGDVFIKLCDIARFYEFDLSDAISERWTDVSQRDWKANPIGHGINGS